MLWRALVVSLLVSGCHSAGPYGYSRAYTPLDAEEDASAGAKELDPVMVTRAPDEWRNAKVSVFGVVNARNDGPGGAADLTLGMRTLAERNLCDDADEATCRVTVSSHEHATVHAIVQLQGEDDLGRRSVQPGSLLRIVGRLADGVDKDDGAPVLQVQYYRHWPRVEYVTDRDADHMRR